MKILISIDCGKTAWYFKALGLARAFTAAGHECFLWDINSKSSFDVFDEINPDIFIGQSYRLTEALILCIKEKPFMKVILKAGEWGQSLLDVDQNKFPVLTASIDEITHVKKLQEIDKPDFLFVHYEDSFIDYTHGRWTKELGVPVHSIMNGADTFAFTNGVPQKEYACDIMFLGGYWKYKSQVLNQWLLPLCETFKYNIKIFGNSHWPCPQYCGYLPDGHEANALASAKICINLHEPHSQVFGYDVVERPFKLASNKCFMMSDHVKGLEKAFPNSSKYLNTYKTPEAMHQDIHEFLSDWDNHSAYIFDSKEALYKECIEKHTYFDRAYKIFDKLGLDTQGITEAKEKNVRK